MSKSSYDIHVFSLLSRHKVYPSIKSALHALISRYSTPSDFMLEFLKWLIFFRLDDSIGKYEIEKTVGEWASYLCVYRCLAERWCV